VSPPFGADPAEQVIRRLLIMFKKTAVRARVGRHAETRNERFSIAIHKFKV